MMQDLQKDSSLYPGTGLDNYVQAESGLVFSGTPDTRLSEKIEGLYSKNLNERQIPDWFFIIALGILSIFAWIRVTYGKYLNNLWISSYSYQLAWKAYSERGVVEKRFGMGLDVLYIVNGSLFLYLLTVFLTPGTFKGRSWQVIGFAFLLLLSLMVIRMFVMHLTGYLFARKELFSMFLYHFFLYNKVIGIVLLPFLITLPFTRGLFQEILIFTGITSIVIIHFARLFRAGIYLLKNVVLLFYLILYLCILEILPILVIIKVTYSLVQV